MSSIFTNEFYEHLYRLEEQSTSSQSWIDIVDDNNEDLVWVKNYVNLRLHTAEQSLFAKQLQRRLDCGIVAKYTLGRSFGLSPKEVERKIKEVGLYDHWLAAQYYWRGYVITKGRNVDTFVRTSAHGAQIFNLSSKKSFSNYNTSGSKLRGFRVYSMRKWKELQPDFSLPEGELLKNEIIRVA